MFKLFTIEKSEGQLLKKSFTYAGYGFLAIFIIGLTISLSIDKSGVLGKVFSTSGSYNWKMYSQAVRSGAFSAIGRLSMIAIFLILASSVLTIFWSFRVMSVSKFFIISTFGTFIIANGIGFGLLFLTWKAIDLFVIFAIASLIFFSAAAYAYYSKSAYKAGKLVFAMMPAMMILMIINLVLLFTHIYSNIISTITSMFFAVFIIAWTIYDIWRIKTSDYFYNAIQNSGDQLMEYRIVAWSTFRLLSDFLSIIYIVFRFYQRSLR